MGVFNCNTHATTTLQKSFIDIISCVVVASATNLVDHDPFFTAKVHSLLDWESPHHILIDVDDLVLLENLGLWQDRLVSHIDGVAVDGEVPVLEDWLSDQDLDELVDVSHLLVWVDTTDGEAVTHSWASPDTVRHSINTAVFGWKMDHVFAVFDDDQRLIQIFDLLVVDRLHVLGHTDLLVVVDELLVYGVCVIVDITDLIGTLVTPVSDDR